MNDAYSNMDKNMHNLIGEMQAESFSAMDDFGIEIIKYISKRGINFVLMNDDCKKFYYDLMIDMRFDLKDKNI